VRTLNLFALGFSIFARLSGATAEKPPLQHEMMGVANGCFVETIAFLDHWQERFGGDAWARMLQWGAKADEEVVAGHAVAVCDAKGKLWCWDINFGWKPVPVDAAQREDTQVVSASVLARYPKISAFFPVYRADVLQAAMESPPAAQATSDNASIRDASLVGERLARHRAVNVVRFSRQVGGDTIESAAAVFLFNGRYCVYVPEVGTIPFRTRGGVENLRLILECLRRMAPGAMNVRKL
jgi:hypothetical protein